jgi:hypothetical protein
MLHEDALRSGFALRPGKNVPDCVSYLPVLLPYTWNLFGICLKAADNIALPPQSYSFRRSFHCALVGGNVSCYEVVLIGKARRKKRGDVFGAVICQQPLPPRNLCLGRTVCRVYLAISYSQP